MGNKAAVIISVISLAFSILSLSHDFIVKEYGLVIGNQKYTITPSEKMKIQNSVNGLSIAPIIDISNDGTVPIRVNKIKAFIKFNGSQHVFNTMATISLLPNTKYKDYIWFGEKYADGDQLIKDTLKSNILHDLMSSYYAKTENNVNKNKDNPSPIFLSKGLYNEVCENLRKQVEWMKSDDDYYLLVMIWFNSETKEPDIKSLYQFSLNDYQLKILSNYQIDGLKTPNDFPGNIQATYMALPILTSIKEIDKILNVYESYKRYAVKTN